MVFDSRTSAIARIEIQVAILVCSREGPAVAEMMREAFEYVKRKESQDTCQSNLKKVVKK